MSYDSFKVRLVMRLLVIFIFIATSVPFIWSIRVFPTYKILKPVHQLESPREYNYFISYNILARYVKEITEPSEKVAFFKGFDIRPELWYYLDRDFRVVPKRRDMLSVDKRRSYAFIIVNGDNIGVDFLSYLLKNRNFVFTDHFYAFDLGNHLRSVTFLRKNVKERSDLASYFISLPHSSYSVEEDRWKMVDLTLKLRGKDEAQHVKKAIKPKKTSSLSEAVARYNLERSAGGKTDLKEIRSHLNIKDDIVFADSIEYLGSSIERHGGRTYVRFLFKPGKQIDFSFHVKITAEPLHEDTKLRDEIGRKVRIVRFVIPSIMWEEGYVYTAENELLLFPGPYSLSFELIQSVTFQVLDETGKDNNFTFKCNGLPDDFSESVESLTSKILGITSFSPQTPGAAEGMLKNISSSKFLTRKDLGSDLKFIGCITVPCGTGKWSARMFFHNISIQGRHLNLTLKAKGPGLKSPYRKTIDIGLMTEGKAPGRIFMIEELMNADPSKLSMTMLFASRGVPSPLQSKKGTKFFLGKGDYGIHLPFQWLYWYGMIK